MCRERRLLVLANKGPDLAPGQRYRFEQWAPRLKREHGITLDLVPFESPRLSEIMYDVGRYPTKAAWITQDFLRRLKALSSVTNYDAVLIYREAALIGPAVYERVLAASGKPIIFDFDDAIWSPDQVRLNGAFAHLKFVGKTSTICKLATAVTTGNEFLASYARKRNAAVYVIPSTIELDVYPLLPEASERDKFVVCWTGSPSTLGHFELARAALERLSMFVPLVVKVICSRPPDRPIAGADTRFIRWSPEDEAAQVADCHVGIMPLQDDEISRGKCAMKALQYMATGRPVVVSPVGMNVEVVKHGDNGFLASSTDDFVSALLYLAKSPAERSRLGKKARKTIEEKYSAAVASRAFATVVHSVVS